MQPLSGTPCPTPVLQALHDVVNVIMMGGGGLLLDAANVEKHPFMCLGPEPSSSLLSIQTYRDTPTRSLTELALGSPEILPRLSCSTHLVSS